jgi:hypothetical protein
MADVIDVTERGPGHFTVTVGAGRSRTTHDVSVDPAYAARLAGDAVALADLVRASFEFLLEREPKEAILSRFELPVIARYFPEYEHEIGRRLRP